MLLVEAFIFSSDAEAIEEEVESLRAFAADVAPSLRGGFPSGPHLGSGRLKPQCRFYT